MEGLISNIQKFSTHDGPGIRTTVFLKGCNLSCFWCHNPESISSKIELQVFSSKCISCMKCMNICSKDVHSFENGTRILYRENCIVCGSCVRICPSKALLLSGESVTTEELVRRIERDSSFYKSSGGGITFSGGEPLLQKDFLMEVLLQCKKMGYHTAIESAANVPWTVFEDIYGLLDLFIIDIKTMDREIHKSVARVSNDLIINNIKKLDSLDKDLWIRTPIISGINDNVESINNIAEFVRKLKNVKKVELIPFHKMAINKYESLGMNYGAASLEPPSSQLMKELNSLFLIKTD